MNETSNSEMSGVEKSVLFYANASWLRTTIVGIAGAIGVALPTVPAVVGAFDVAITMKAQKIAERRLNVLCQSWEQEIHTLPKNQVDKEYIESEEFFDLVFQAWESTKRTRHDEKIRLYAKLLAATVPFQDRQEHIPEDYLSVLTELSPTEIEVARVLFEEQRQKPNDNESKFQWLTRIGVLTLNQKAERHESAQHQWQNIQSRCPSVNEQNIEFVLLRLQRSGLVNELSGTYYDYSGGVFVINETFRQLMNYLEGTEKHS